MPSLSWKIVDRYLAGEASAAERQLVERWLAESETFRRLVADLYRSELDEGTIRQAAAEVRARLEGEILSTESVDRPGVPGRSNITRRTSLRPGARRLKVAAALLLLFGGSWGLWQTVQRAETHPVDASRRVVTAPAGRRVPVSLPDGSHVTLSPGSTLHYAATFGAERREVHLEGEAYFDVDHDARRPFVVHAGDLIAEDLGTEFVVRAYPEDPYGQVVVRKGLVGIGRAVVAPGQLGRLTADRTPIVEPADTTSWFAWVNGDLLFAGTPLREALPKLSRWYDVRFRLADSSLGNIELVGDLPAKLDDDALNTLALILKLRVTREGRVVTFHPAPKGSSES